MRNHFLNDVFLFRRKLEKPFTSTPERSVTVTLYALLRYDARHNLHGFHYKEPVLLSVHAKALCER